MEANPKETALPTCFVCKKQIPENEWFCRLTQKMTDAAHPQAPRILLCSPACALRHFGDSKPHQQ